MAKTSFTQDAQQYKVGDIIEAHSYFYNPPWQKATIVSVGKECQAPKPYRVVFIGEGAEDHGLTCVGVDEMRPFTTEQVRLGQFSSNGNRPSNNNPPSNSYSGQSGMNPSQSIGGNNQQQQQNQGGYGAPQTPAQRNINGVYPSDINGAWNGTYTCQQGLTNLVMSLSAKSETEVEGIFTFLFGEGPDPVLLGSYKVKGTYDSRSGRIELKGVDWDDKPAGWVLVDLSGTVMQPKRRMVGNVIGANCTTFQLEKINFK